MTDSKKLDLLLQEVSSIKVDVQQLNHNVSGLELHLENTTDKNIKTIAEGYLDLSSKLDNAPKSETEKNCLLSGYVC